MADEARQQSFASEQESSETGIEIENPTYPTAKAEHEQESSDSAGAGVDIPNIDDSNNQEESTAGVTGAGIEDDDDVEIDVVGGIVDPIPNTMLTAIDTDTEVVNLAEDLDLSEDSSSDDGDNKHQPHQADQTSAIEDNKLNILAATLSDLNSIFTAQLQVGTTDPASEQPKSPTSTTTAGNGVKSMEVKTADAANSGAGTGTGISAVKDIELNLTKASLDVKSESVLEFDQSSMNMNDSGATGGAVNLSESVMEFGESSMNMNDSGAGTTETGTEESSNDQLDTETESDSPPFKMARYEFDRDLIPDRISTFDRGKEARGMTLYCLHFKNSDKTARIGAQEAHVNYPELIDKFYQNLATKKMPF